jgi:ribosome biogenesis GTPase
VKPSRQKQTDATIQGVITAAFGRHYEVDVTGTQDRTAALENKRLQCYPRGKKSVFACGDEVDITLTGDTQGVIAQLQEFNLCESVRVRSFHISQKQSLA